MSAFGLTLQHQVYYNKRQKAGEEMAICYNPLWKLLIDKGLKKTDLRVMANISNSTLAKLGKGEYVSMKIIERLCKALDCNIGDIMEITSEK